jgi:hypothetical protein
MPGDTMVRRIARFALLSVLSLVVSIATAQDSLPPAMLPSVVPARPLPVQHWHHAPAPAYLILRQAGGGVAQPTVGHPYAYGWFGVAPRRHTVVHHGYYGGLWLMPGRLAP